MRVQDLFDLTGRTAIVTGGGSGIGRQMAEGLAEAGANVVLCARKLERCEQAAAELAELVVRTREELGSVDVLVSNAGTVWGAPPEEMPLQGWQKVIDVNLTGVFLFAQ